MIEVMPKQVNNRNSIPYVGYLKRHYSNLDIQKNIIDEINKGYEFFVENPKTGKIELLTAEHLKDINVWMSNLCYDYLYRKAAEKIDNPGYGYSLGRESMVYHPVLWAFGALLGMEKIVELLPKENRKWNNTKEVIILENNPGHFIVGFQHKPGILVSEIAQDYHPGLLDGGAEVAGQIRFETILRDGKTLPFVGKPLSSGIYFECEGEFKPKSLLRRVFYQYVVRNIPEYGENLDISRQNAIKHREATVRERIQKEIEERTNKNLQKFVSERVIEQCKSDKGPKRNLERTHRSIMFCDIRGYTSLSERVEDTVLDGVLNQYFEAMMNPIYENKGEVDKIIGDNIMAYFKTANDAVSAAIEMRQALEDLNQKLKAQNIPNLDSIRNGIGITTGNMKIGNVGSDKKMMETVMGDVVNVASRLEQLTKEYHVPVIIDENTYEGIEKMVLAREIDKVCPKGKQNSIKIYEVVAPSDIY